MSKKGMLHTNKKEIDGVHGLYIERFTYQGEYGGNAP